MGCFRVLVFKKDSCELVATFDNVDEITSYICGGGNALHLKDAKHGLDASVFLNEYVVTVKLTESEEEENE